uniref:ATP-dependent RNA helicase n=1 Tax=Salarias fasciatus TaxID=181472 RepID=A0A672G3P2_SALFA
SQQEASCSSKHRREEEEEEEEEEKEEEEEEEEPPAAVLPRRDSDRGGIKTSSLFKHNPEIPNLHRPVVSQLKEEIFTTDSFSELELHPHLVATLNKVLNVSTMTSVQRQAVPVLLSGRDAVVRSQTGSGKTLSFAVPLVQNLQSLQPKTSRSDGPLAVIVVPTRELALQTFQTFQKLLKPFSWIVPGVLMGGEKRKSEKARLRKGINVLVSTPGRLVDHVQHTLSLGFSAVRWLVLDEADRRTLDLGFEKDLTEILNSLNRAGSPRQNVLLSATLTHGVTRLADICLKDPVSVQVSVPGSAPAPAPAPVPVPVPARSGPEGFAVPAALQQWVLLVPSKLRLVCLAAFILDRFRRSHDNKLLVFVSSCEAVEFLHGLFTAVLSANRGLRFLRLHGNMKQEERSDVFQQFLESQSGVLLCTVSRRNPGRTPTSCVQYTPPTAAAEYVHRVGRTARIGAAGSSVLFLTPTETPFITELIWSLVTLTLVCPSLSRPQSSSKALEQDVRERATVLQTEFENFVHSNAATLQKAKRALQSFLRAYTTYPAHLKHVFHIRSLHLGHTAKSFGLRDAPQGLSRAGGQNRDQNRDQNRGKNQRSGKKSPGRPAPRPETGDWRPETRDQRPETGVRLARKTRIFDHNSSYSCIHYEDFTRKS